MGKNKNPILVTGSPRSGTTWIGKMLSFGDNVHHIYEPFNRWSPNPISPSKWPFQSINLPYINNSNEADYLHYVKELFERKVPIQCFFRPLIKAILKRNYMMNGCYHFGMLLMEEKTTKEY